MKKTLLFLSVFTLVFTIFGWIVAAPTAGDAIAETSTMRVPVCLAAEGRTYNQTAELSVGARLYAAECGGWHACFAALYQAGGTIRQILNWAAYPLGEGVNAWLATVETQPVDAAISTGKHAPVVTPHRDGRTFGAQVVLAAVADCLEGKAPPALHLRHTPAAVTYEALSKRTQLMASFDTPYTDNPSRVHNLRLACGALNGHVIDAGEEFAFNKTVGARTASRGYKDAKIIVDGRFAEGTGGGVCQVSTTLYNAAMLAGLKQTEVHQHSLAVHYTQPSRDAMVSAWSDMRFVNDTPYPVYLFAEATGGRVRVRIYGLPSAQKVRLKAYSEVTEPFRNVDEAGNVLCETEGYTLLSAGADGIESRLVRITGTRSETLRRNTYPRQDAVWRPIPE